MRRKVLRYEGRGKAIYLLVFRKQHRLLNSSGFTVMTDYKPAFVSLYRRLEKLAKIQ